MRKKEIINVQGVPVNIEEDYICLTDMAKADGDDARAADVIKNWLRTRSTIEFLGTWEAINNKLFNVVEFDHFRRGAGLPTFVLSVTQWIEKTGAIGIFSRQGKYGGTYAHKDIAFEFGSAISPAFKLYLIKEFQRLKEQENNIDNLEWNMKRFLSKAHYHVQTDAVKDYKIPNNKIPEDKQWLAYAEEGDILNLAMFGFTARQWREANPDLALKNKNVRDFASINELAVLATLEGINAEMIKSNQTFNYRLERLTAIAREQLKSLEKVDMYKSFKRTVEGGYQPLYKEEGKETGMFPQMPFGEAMKKISKAGKPSKEDDKEAN